MGGFSETLPESVSQPFSSSGLDINKLISSRRAALNSGDEDAAFVIEDQLKADGITLTDTRDGTKWSMTSPTEDSGDNDGENTEENA